jgi:hypothetical protein
MRLGFYVDGMTTSRSPEVEPHVWHGKASVTHIRRTDVVVQTVTLPRR